MLGLWLLVQPVSVNDWQGASRVVVLGMWLVVQPVLVSDWQEASRVWLWYNRCR